MNDLSFFIDDQGLWRWGDPDGPSSAPFEAREATPSEG
jgi:hypothetical protein